RCSTEPAGTGPLPPPALVTSGSTVSAVRLPVRWLLSSASVRSSDLRGTDARLGSCGRVLRPFPAKPPVEKACPCQDVSEPTAAGRKKAHGYRPGGTGGERGQRAGGIGCYRRLGPGTCP